MAKEPIYDIADDRVSAQELILSAQQWVRYFWTKKWVLLVTGVIGGLFGLWYAYSKTPVYIATTTFVVESSDGRGSARQFAGLAAMAGISIDGGSGLFQGDNILELYKSRSMLAQTLMSKVEPHSDSSDLLIERYINYNGLREGWQSTPELYSLNFRQNPSALDPTTLRLRDSVINSVVATINKGVLEISRPDKTLSIYQVNVTSPDEVFSKVFNESLVQRVNDFYIQTVTKKSTKNVEILQAKVDSVRAVMEGAIYSAARVSDATPNLNPTRQAQRVAPTQEAQFSVEANKTILSQLLQNLELTKMNLLQEQPLIQLVDQPIYPLKEERLGKKNGIIIGGFLFGFLALLFLVLQKVYRDIMVDEEP